MSKQSQPVCFLLRPAEGKEGNFKLVFNGREAVVLSIKASKIVDMEGADDMDIYGEFRPGSDILMQPNSIGNIYLCYGMFLFLFV